MRRSTDQKSFCALRLLGMFLFILSPPVFAFDSDGDGFHDYADNCAGASNPDQLDTDSDSIGDECDADDDGDNVVDEKDPWPLDPKYRFDTDGDGLPDRYELANGLDPNYANDASVDLDSDGLSVLQEFIFGTSDKNTDSDSDTLPDNWEVQHSKNPSTPEYLISLSAGGNHLVWKDSVGITNSGYKEFAGNEYSFGQAGGVRHIISLDDSGSWAPSRVISGDVKELVNQNGWACVIDGVGLLCFGQNLGNIPKQMSVDKPEMLRAGVGYVCLKSNQNIICEGDAYGRWNDKSNIPVFNDLLDYDVNDFGCAIDKDYNSREVKCWDGSSSAPSVPNLISPTAISVGRNTVCVIDLELVKCWGGSMGQETIISDIKNPRDVDWGEEYGCAIDDYGLVCFSNSGYHIAGGLTSISLENAKRLTVGSESACVLDDNGVSCFKIRYCESSSCSARDYQVNRRLPLISLDADGDNRSSDKTSLSVNPNSICSDMGKCGLSNFGLVSSEIDLFPLSSEEWTDFDSDGTGDNSDSDDDNDGFNDEIDSFPSNSSEWQDLDGDGVGDNADLDDDNDGIDDLDDAFPLDASEQFDSDGDGVGNNQDNCRDIINLNQIDTDRDSVGDACDSDDDNDGLIDVADAFPLDIQEQVDSDNDGVGDNADFAPNDASEQLDTDDDGLGDNADNCMNVSNSNQLNTDDDALGNACDQDDDNDGLPDSQEAAYGTNPLLVDTDGDGFSDKDEVDYDTNPLDKDDGPSSGGLDWFLIKAAKDQQEAASE